MRRLLPLLLTVALGAQSSWSAPVPVPALNSTASDLNPHLSADGLTMHFSSYRGGGWDIWVATRPTKSAPWGVPVVVTELSDPVGVDSEPFLRADGLEIFFSRSGAGGQGGIDILRATRASAAQPWSTPAFVTEVNSIANDSAASLTADGLTMYLLSSRAGAPAPPNAAPYVCTRPSLASPFTAPVLVPEFATPDAYRDLEVSGSGLVVSFTRSGASRVADIWFATRTNPGAAFGTPQPVVEFRSTELNLAGTLSAEGNVYYFCRLFGTSPAYEIYESRFEGLTQQGRATVSGAMRLHYRDSASAMRPHAGALSAGNAGFMLGSRQVPLNPDALLLATFAAGVPPLTTGFVGLLDPNGEATATLTTWMPALAGIKVHAGWFTLDVTAPFGIKTISNSTAIELLQ
jgi:hypothetical protein